MTMRIGREGIVYYDGEIFPPEPAQIKVCESWIRAACRRRATRNPQAQSCSLKRLVERWSGRCISNGALIQAAVQLGYRASPGSDLSYEATFNMAILRGEE